MRGFAILAIFFVLNFAVLDSLTTKIALDSCCFESNPLIRFDVLTAKLLATPFIIGTAYWTYRKDKNLGRKAMIAIVAFSAGVVYNNVLNILGGLS